MWQHQKGCYWYQKGCHDNWKEGGTTFAKIQNGRFWQHQIYVKMKTKSYSVFLDVIRKEIECILWIHQSKKYAYIWYLTFQIKFRIYWPGILCLIQSCSYIFLALKWYLQVTSWVAKWLTTLYLRKLVNINQISILHRIIAYCLVLLPKWKFFQY